MRGKTYTILGLVINIFEFSVTCVETNKKTKKQRCPFIFAKHVRVIPL
jgi:hypothetical protein